MASEKRVHYSDGALPTYFESLGRPEIILGDRHIPLTEFTDPGASKLRLYGNGRALFKKAVFNYRRLITNIYWYDDETIVFARANGEIAYVLNVANKAVPRIAEGSNIEVNSLIYDKLEEIREKAPVEIRLTSAGLEFLNEAGDVLFVIPFAGKGGA